MRIRRLAFFALLTFAAAKLLAAQTPTPVMQAWAMLFQMMDRLHAQVSQHDLSVVHYDDPVANSAVSILLAQAGKTPTKNSGLTRVRLIEFVRDISALHTAADANQEDKCAEIMKKAEGEFQQLQAEADPALLHAARSYARRFTCPMHPEVIGAKDAPCSKCGMALEQMVVLMPTQDGTGTLAAPESVRATIETDAPLEVGKKAFAVLHLRRAGGEPVLLSDLIETHTKKIHLLIVDKSLTDYHHEHPRMTETPGDYVFEFTPQKPGPYLAWADVRPLPLGLQEYDQTTIAGTGHSEALSDRETKLSAVVEGLRFELVMDKSVLKVGRVTEAKLRVTKADGTGFGQLEPVMAAFAHVVGFNEDETTVLHLHPTGASVLDEKLRGGPELPLKIYASKAGFTRFFAQVQIGGRQVFVPFGLEVLP